jgi:hypothetical protein
MAPASNATAALRAEISQLQEQLTAANKQASDLKDKLIVSKDQLLTLKDENMALKTEQLTHCRSKEVIGAAEAQQKRQCVANSSSLKAAATLAKDDIVDHVFCYVAGGDHFYIAGVSRRWRGRYLRHCVLRSNHELDKKLVTRHRSVLMSESRLQLALANGLSVVGWVLNTQPNAEMICKHSLEPVQVMALLRVHGVPWNEKLCIGAAYFNRLQLLQWLHSSSCPWDGYDVLYAAGRGGSVAMFEWLLTVTAPWTNKIKTAMLVRAAWHGKLAAMQWLRAHGAQ